MDILDLYPIEREALANGELVYRIDQNTVDPKTDFPDLAREDAKDGVDDLSEGICAGLVLHWMGQRYEGRDFRSCLTPLTDEARVGGPNQVQVANAAIREAVRNQNLAGPTKRNDPAFLSYVQAVLLLHYGIHVNRRGFRSSAVPISADLIDREFDRTGRGLFYVGMRRPAGASKKFKNAGGHAIGIHYEDNGVRLFDGNTGSFAFKTRRRFLDFFARYLAQLGYPEICREATWIGKVDTGLGYNHKADVSRLNHRFPMFQRNGSLQAPSDPVHHNMRRPASPGRMSGGWSNERPVGI